MSTKCFWKYFWHGVWHLKGVEDIYLCPNCCRKLSRDEYYNMKFHFAKEQLYCDKCYPKEKKDKDTV